ncbi:MAG: protein kinase [Acidobacteriota bacterium]
MTTVLAAGSRLGPYEVLGLLGEGGMGQVWRARDTRLNRDVAIKVLPAAFSSDPERVRRFEIEAHAAAQLDHPNVLVIHDVGEHQGAPYIVTELLEGEPLRSRLQGRPLPVDDALALATQVAQGLSAAHAKGIVHRDFKPENLFITSAGIVKILDFGLAKLLPRVPGLDSESAPTTMNATEPGAVMGSMAYISPEQLEGKSVGPATDIYSFGVVLFEMLTGRLPFEAASPIAAAAKRLNETPKPPSAIVPDLPAAVDDLVMHCLARSPEDRLPDGTALLRALTAPPKRRMIRAARSRFFNLGIVAAVMLALAGALLIGRMIHRGSVPGREEPRPSAGKARRSVAVLGFRNSSGRPDAAWLSTALAEMLTTELAAGGTLRTVPGENVARAVRDLDLRDIDTLGTETLHRVGEQLGADFVVIGSYVAIDESLGGRLRLDARIQDTAAGESVALLSEEGSVSRLFEVVSAAGSSLRARLGVAAVPSEELPAVQASLPASPAAARLYAAGLERIRRFEAVDAIKPLQEAVDSDPTYPFSHWALALAWSQLGYDRRAQDEAKKAFELSAPLSAEGKLAIEGRYRILAGDWARATQIYGDLMRSYPDNLEYGLELARSQAKGGHATDALATLAQLRKLQKPASDDPRIDLAEADAAYALADYRHQRDAAAAAASRAESMGARLLTARARLTEARALRQLGENAAAQVAAETARTIYEAVGDRDGAAQAQNVLASMLYNQGDLEGARRLASDLLTTYREIGNQRGVALALNTLANVAYSQGDLKAAAAAYEEALVSLQAIDERSSVSKVLSNLANALFLQGQVKEARRRQEENLRLAGEIGNRSAGAFSTVALGEIMLAMGDVTAAEARYTQALKAFQETGEKSGQAFCIYGLGDVAVARGELAQARAKYSESMALHESLGEKQGVADCHMASALLSMEESAWPAAENLARRAAGEYRAEDASDKEAWALSIAARSLLAQGKLTEAARDAKRAIAQASKGQNLAYLLAAKLATACCQVASGDLARARQELEEIIETAATAGRVDIQMEAELELAGAELKAGAATEGANRLGALEKNASSRGLVLVARKAAARRAGGR